MELWRYAILFLMVLEIFIYFVKYWNFFSADIFLILLKKYGVPLFRFEIQSRQNKEKLQF